MTAEHDVGDVPLCERYDVALLDLDGVVYRGGHAVRYAPESLSTASHHGMRLAYVTNNASRTPAAIAAHLTELGVPAEATDIVTSAQAGARLLTELIPAGSAVLVVGGKGLRVAVAERGFRPVESVADAPAAVIQGFSPDIGWAQLAEAAYGVAAGLTWVATNGDMTVPTDRGIAPGNGTLVAAVAAATGRKPAFAGKPYPPLHLESIDRTEAKAPLTVGDRLDTDIEGAAAAGTDSLLVLTGVTDLRQAWLAPTQHRPTYIAADLRALLAPAPRVSAEEDAWVCDGWAARIDGSAIELVERPRDASPPGAAAGGSTIDIDERRSAWLPPVTAVARAAWQLLDDGRKPDAESLARCERHVAELGHGR
ncbi:MAG: HAD-IIA family hydrolase [Actinomycetales bacterium]